MREINTGGLQAEGENGMLNLNYHERRASNELDNIANSTLYFFLSQPVLTQYPIRPFRHLQNGGSVNICFRNLGINDFDDPFNKRDPQAPTCTS